MRTDLIVMFFVVVFFSSPKQIGGDDQWIGCCHDGRKAWAGVHGGSGEDTQSKWVHKEEGLNWCLCFMYVHNALSFCSSQWQHKQQSGALVVLWSSGSGGNDTRTDLLPEEIFWSTASSVVWFKKSPSVSSTVFSNAETRIYTLEMTQFWVNPHIWLDRRYFCFPVTVGFLLKKKLRHTHSEIDVNVVLFF